MSLVVLHKPALEVENSWKIGNKGDGIPFLTSSPSSSNPVHVVNGIDRYVIIDHVRQGWNVYSSSNNISRNQNLYFPQLKRLQGRLSFPLREIRMKEIRTKTIVLQALSQSFCTLLSSAKHQNLAILHPGVSRTAT